MLAVSFIVGMQWFYAGVYVGPVRQAVEGLVPHPKILVLSGEAAIGHPLVRDVNGVWVSRQENLWIREFVRLTRERTVVDAATDAKLNDDLALERKWLIEDFKKMSPDSCWSTICAASGAPGRAPMRKCRSSQSRTRWCARSRGSTSCAGTNSRRVAATSAICR